MKTKIEVDKKYKIVAGTEIWSLAMHEFISLKRDVIVKITSPTVFGFNGKEVTYGILQTTFANPVFQMFIGDAATVYLDKKNGEIGIDAELLKEI
jgi:hypothetical protein